MTNPRRIFPWIAPLFLVTGLAGCESPTAAPPEATFTASWAGSPWHGSASATLFPAGSSDTLYVHGSSPPNAGSMPHQVVTFRIAGFTGPGTYQLEAADVTFRELVGGDVVVATYAGAGSPAGTIVVTRYDGVARVVEGGVHARTVFTYGHALHGTGAEFSNGVFRAQLFTVGAAGLQ